VKEAAMRSLFPASAALAASLVLAACGGGSAGDAGMTPSQTPAASTSVPDSAIASASAMVSYLDALPSQDAVEPLSLPTADAAVSDTDEPAAV